MNWTQKITHSYYTHDECIAKWVFTVQRPFSHAQFFYLSTWKHLLSEIQTGNIHSDKIGLLLPSQVESRWLTSSASSFCTYKTNSWNSSICNQTHVHSLKNIVTSVCRRRFIGRSRVSCNSSLFYDTVNNGKFSSFIQTTTRTRPPLLSLLISIEPQNVYYTQTYYICVH